MLLAGDRNSEIKQHKMAWASLAPLGIHQDQLKGGMVQFMMEFEKFWHAYRRKDTAKISNYQCYHTIFIQCPEQVTTSIYRVEQRKRMFFKWLVLGKDGVEDVGREPVGSSDNAISVAMAHWNVEHRVFAVEHFFRNSYSIVTVRLFRRKFNVECRGAIPPDRNTII